jgi:hypothetical protein
LVLQSLSKDLSLFGLSVSQPLGVELAAGPTQPKG